MGWFPAKSPIVLALVALVSLPLDTHAQDGHHGPAVAPGSSGPARYVASIYDAFDPDKAMRDAAFFDGFFRTPGGEGYELCLKRLEERLRAEGFGSDRRLALDVLETTMDHPSWTPRSASLILRADDSRAEVLQAFSRPGDVHRVMLPINAPSADVEGRPVFQLDQVVANTILVTEALPTRSIIRRAQKRGAVAILSSNLFSFTVDPTGAGRHEDAIRFTTVAPGTTLPIAQISPRVHNRIAAAVEASADAWLAFTADVEFGSKILRTLVATVVGRNRPGETIAIASHLQEPGAGDNASGNAGLLESACSLVRLLKAEKVAWPSRSVTFIWGDEIKQSRLWLAQTKRTTIAAISADMLGQSPTNTGSIALLERMQDPGALVTLEPDSHTPWGAGEVIEEDLHPNGLALIARSALADVATHVGGWRTSENPWEGGSDHDVFLDAGIPAVLIWHFTDFTYHTSLDRLEMLDPEELRRSCAVVLATALATADPVAGDLERYLASNELELELRLEAAEAAGESEVAEQWKEWCAGAAEWLRAQCAAR